MRGALVVAVSATLPDNIRVDFEVRAFEGKLEIYDHRYCGCGDVCSRCGSQEDAEQFLPDEMSIDDTLTGRALVFGIVSGLDAVALSRRITWGSTKLGKEAA